MSRASSRRRSDRIVTTSSCVLQYVLQVADEVTAEDRHGLADGRSRNQRQDRLERTHVGAVIVLGDTERRAVRTGPREEDGDTGEGNGERGGGQHGDVRRTPGT